MEQPLSALAALTNTELKGDGNIMITGVNTLEDASANELSFLANKKYSRQLEQTSAGAVIIPGNIDTDKPALISKNPYADFVKIVSMFAPKIPLPEPGIHPTAIIDQSATIGENVAIGPYCIVGAGVKIGRNTVLAAQVYISEETTIGDDCIFYPQVVIREKCIVGHRVILNPGVVIGGDGFGFAPYEGKYFKIPQIGNVVIEDDVEIGANTTVDRAALNATRIGEGSKIDNLVMVAHNVVIGKHTVVAGQAGLSGSGKIGDHVMVGGQAGTAGHIKVGNKVIIGGQSGVTKDVADGSFINGYPAKSHKAYMRELADIGRIAELRKKVKALEARLEELEKND